MMKFRTARMTVWYSYCLNLEWPSLSRGRTGFEGLTLPPVKGAGLWGLKFWRAFNACSYFYGAKLRTLDGNLPWIRLTVVTTYGAVVIDVPTVLMSPPGTAYIGERVLWRNGGFLVLPHNIGSYPRRNWQSFLSIWDGAPKQAAELSTVKRLCVIRLYIVFQYLPYVYLGSSCGIPQLLLKLHALLLCLCDVLVYVCRSFSFKLCVFYDL